MQPSTRFLSRLIGLYCVLISLAMIAHKPATVVTLNEFIHNRPAMLISGALAVAGGLAIVLRHDIWSGGLTPVIVTLMGWTSLAKGVSILFLSPIGQEDFYGAVGFDQYFYLYMGFAFLVGVWLTWSGFSPAARK